MTKNDGGPAFPRAASHDGYAAEQGHEGMSLRDYFAAHAPEPSESELQHQYECDKIANPHNDSYKPKRRSRNEIRTDLRYEYADAMIATRQR